MPSNTEMAVHYHETTQFGLITSCFHNFIITALVKTDALIFCTVCFIYLYYTLKIEHLKVYFSPKCISGLFESTYAFSECCGLSTMLSAGLYVSKLFINEKLSLVFGFLVDICCFTFVQVYE